MLFIIKNTHKNIFDILKNCWVYQQKYRCPKQLPVMKGDKPKCFGAELKGTIAMPLPSQSRFPRLDFCAKAHCRMHWAS